MRKEREILDIQIQKTLKEKDHTKTQEETVVMHL